MNKERVKRFFSKSAMTYDENAYLQRCIQERLITKIRGAGISPKRILDIGAGTGGGSEKLCGLFPEAKIVLSDIAHGMMSYAKSVDPDCANRFSYVTSDMERLPFKEDTFDLVYSSAAAHWAENVSEAFLHARKVIRDSGVFCFSTFGADTLKELNSAFSETYSKVRRERREHINRFTPFDKIIIGLKKAGFSNIKSEVEAKRISYKDVLHLLKSLKAIGSHKVASDAIASQRYLGKDFLQKVFKSYENNFRENGGIYATYMIYYFVCRV